MVWPRSEAVGWYAGQSRYELMLPEPPVVRQLGFFVAAKLDQKRTRSSDSDFSSLHGRRQRAHHARSERVRRGVRGG